MEQACFWSASHSETSWKLSTLTADHWDHALCSTAPELTVSMFAAGPKGYPPLPPGPKDYPPRASFSACTPNLMPPFIAAVEMEQRLIL
jgi:hypothetical protein